MTLKLTEEEISQIILEETRTVFLKEVSDSPLFGKYDGIALSWRELEDIWTSFSVGSAWETINKSGNPMSHQAKADALFQAMKGGTGIGTDERAVLALLANSPEDNNEINRAYAEGAGSLEDDLRGELSNLAWTGLGRKLETAAMLLLLGKNWGEWDPSTGSKMTSGDKEAAKADSTTNYPIEKMRTRSIVQFNLNIGQNRTNKAFAFRHNGKARIVDEDDQNQIYTKNGFKIINSKNTEEETFLYNDLLKQFLKTYPKEVYSGGDTYERVFDNKYTGPTNRPGDTKEFTLEPGAAATNESRSLTEDMVLNPVDGGQAIAVTSSPSGGRIPSKGVTATPQARTTRSSTSATAPPEKRRIYYSGQTEEVKKIQKALIDLGYDLGKFGPKKDGIDGRFGAKTLAAWQEATGAKTPPSTATEAYKDVLKGAETREQPAVPEEGEKDIRGDVDAEAAVKSAQLVSQQVEQAMEQYGTTIPKTYTTEDELVSLFPIPRIPKGSSEEAIAKQVEIRNLVQSIAMARKNQIDQNNSLNALKEDLIKLANEMSRVEAMKRGSQQINKLFNDYKKVSGSFDMAKGIDKKAKIKFYLAQQINKKTSQAAQAESLIKRIAQELANGGATKKKYTELTQELRELLRRQPVRESTRFSEEELQQIILEETSFLLKKRLNEAKPPPKPGSLDSIRAAFRANTKSTGTGLGQIGGKGAKASKAAKVGKGIADVGRLMGVPGQAGAGLFKLLGLGVLGRIVGYFFSWPVMIGWQVWDELVSPFTIEAKRGDITKTYQQKANSQEASRMRDNIDKAADAFLIKVQEYVKGYEGFSFLELILDLTGGPLNIIPALGANTDIVGYITSKFTNNPVSAAIKKRRVEASIQFYKILQEHGPEVLSNGEIVPNSPQKVQGLEAALNAEISKFLKQEYDILQTTDISDLIGRSIPTKSQAESELKASAKPLVDACLEYYEFIGGSAASQGKEAGPAADSTETTGGAKPGAAGAAAGAVAARTITPKQATYTGRVRDLTAKVRSLLKSNGVKSRDQQDAWISWTRQTMEKDKTARDETILSVIEEWLGFTSERTMRENRHLMEGIGLVLPKRGEYEFSDFKEWLEDNNKEIGFSREYGLHNPRHLRRYLDYVRKFKSNEARAKRQDKRSQRISKRIEKNREQIMSLQADLEKLGNSKKDQKKAERLQNKIGRLTGAEERKELRSKKVKLRKKDIRK